MNIGYLWISTKIFNLIFEHMQILVKISDGYPNMIL